MGSFGRMFVAAVLQAAYATSVGYDMQCAITYMYCVIMIRCFSDSESERAFPVVVAPPWRSGV